MYILYIKNMESLSLGIWPNAPEEPSPKVLDLYLWLVRRCQWQNKKQKASNCC